MYDLYFKMVNCLSCNYFNRIFSAWRDGRKFLDSLVVGDIFGSDKYYFKTDFNRFDITD